MDKYTWTRRTSDEYEAEHGGAESRQMWREVHGCAVVALGVQPNNCRHVNQYQLSISGYPTIPDGVDPDAYADAYAARLAAFAATVHADVMADLSARLLLEPELPGLDAAILAVGADLG